MANIVKRVLRFDAAQRRLFEMIYEAAAIFRPGPGRSEKRTRLETVLAKLEPGTLERDREQGQNPDLTLRTIRGPLQLELPESERDLLIEAMDAIDWPGFASAKAGAARQLLLDAERVEEPAPAAAAKPQ